MSGNDKQEKDFEESRTDSSCCGGCSTGSVDDEPTAQSGVSGE